MSKSIRVRTTPNGNSSYLKVNLEQDFDFIEILSLKISQEEVYRRFCSDYGVVVGRVNVNSGFGVPNARVSIFVPISEVDLEDPEISGLYPFETIKDTDSEGIRYNLLPRTSKGKDECHTPVGTFPNKREIIDNDIQLEIYEKYYKYTTVTNNAGDFMIFGVPVGTWMMQVEADLSDIGIISQRPYDFIREGEGIKSFESPTKFKKEQNLDTLNQIKYKKPIGINVAPFWGDEENCQIGIVREDVDLQYNVKPSAIFVGALFGDSEENSINKACVPRVDMGNLCDQVTAQGQIEMIRKTTEGKVERFDVEGGRTIDENGAWAYQIPMNLDHVITDEFGNLVQTDDPNKGIATRASVRFRIGMDQTGGEAKLRARAKYLVPHNPINSADQDYTFGQQTSENHFRDIYWNKIYTVKNFIPRIQPTCLPLICPDNRAMTGIKNTDDCSGNHTDFPFNRLDTDLNPLFTVICLIMQIIVLIVGLINGVMVPFINFILVILNAILGVICDIVYAIGGLGCFWDNDCLFDVCMSAENDPSGYDPNTQKCDCTEVIPYLACITIDCPQGEAESFAPGCCGPNVGVGDNNTPDTTLDDEIVTLGWRAAARDNGQVGPQHYGCLDGVGSCYADDGGGTTHAGHEEFFTIEEGVSGNGLLDCLALELADALNVFEFDFYNDWINGSLYTFLLEYQKQKNGKEELCEYDCGPASADGDKDGRGDNPCTEKYMVDTMDPSGNGHNLGDVYFATDPLNPNVQRTANKAYSYLQVYSGLVKRFEDELYYAAYTTELGLQRRLFATDIVHLGSVFDCDWQGIPSIHSFLTPTTYKTAPLISQTVETVDGNSIKVKCGKSSIGVDGSGDGYFFDINCLAISVSPRHASNIRTFCEAGVNPNSEVNLNDAVNGDTNCNIGDEDISSSDRFFRGVLYALNVNGTNITNLPNQDIIDAAAGTSFGWTRGFGQTPPPASAGNLNMISQTSPSGHLYHENWRDLPTMHGDLKQPDNSYYFYFGIIPGKSAVELMNSKYFTPCFREVEDDFVVVGDVTSATTIGAADGSITLTIVGGTAPYSYDWVGPVDPSNVLGGPYTNFSTNNVGDGTYPDDSITWLIAGSYNVTVQDATGGIAKGTFVVSGPVPVSCKFTPFPLTTNTSNDGRIRVDSLIGGSGTYEWTVVNSSNVTIVSQQTVTVGSEVTNLPEDDYTITVTDSSVPPLECVTTVTGVTAPPPLSMVIDTTDTCGNSNDGTLSITPNGGVPPYTATTVAGSGNSYVVPTSQTNLFNIGTLPSGNYNVTLEDSIGQSTTSTANIGSVTAPSLSKNESASYGCWINGSAKGGFLSFTFTITGSGSHTLRFKRSSLSLPTITRNAGTHTITTNDLSDLNTSGVYSLRVESTNGCISNGISFNMTENNDDSPDTPLLPSSEFNPSVVGSSDASGDITISASGGFSSSYQYKLDSGSWTTFSTSTTISPSLGAHTVQVRDAKGCSKSFNVTTT